MDLPKNITLIGESNPYCKVYVEDYAACYLKQLNGPASDKEIAVGLYGVRKEENGITYLFCYCACKLLFLQKETRHLSQAVLQEVEKSRKKYFEEYEFLGYKILNGELIEGFYVYEHDVCRYVGGYAQFYEKNDSMLQFMLEERKEGEPEKIDQEKYEEVKRRQEERRRLSNTNTSKAEGTYESASPWKATVAAALVLLCVAGVATTSGQQKIREIQQNTKKLVEGFSENKFPELVQGITEKYLPDAVEVSGGQVQNVSEEADSKVAEEQEQSISEGEDILDINQEITEQEGAAKPQNPENEEIAVKEPLNGEETMSQESDAEKETANNETKLMQPDEGSRQSDKEDEQAVEQEAASTKILSEYTVRKGDTLLGICLQIYGTSNRMKEICELNHISNPDDIKEGEKILLPQ